MLIKNKIFFLFSLFFSLSFLLFCGTAKAVDNSLIEYWNFNSATVQGGVNSSNLFPFSSWSYGLDKWSTSTHFSLSTSYFNGWVYGPLTTSHSITNGFSYSYWYESYSSSYDSRAEIQFIDSLGGQLSRTMLGFDDASWGYRNMNVPGGSDGLYGCVQITHNGSFLNSWQDQNWHNATVVSDMTDAKVYIDGNLFYDCRFNFVPDYSHGLKDVYVRVPNAGWYMDDVAVFNRPLTDDERTAVLSNEINSSFGFTVPSNLHITDPAGSISVQGLSVNLKGTCVSHSGGEIQQLVVGSGSFMPVLHGNCDCFDNHFDCNYVSPSYGLHTITVIDFYNNSDFDNIALDFTNSSPINWLNYTSYVYNTSPSTSTTVISPVGFYKNNPDGNDSNMSKLWFIFAPQVVASSSDYVFKIYSIRDEDYWLNTDLNSELFGQGNSNQSQLYVEFNLSTDATQTVIAILYNQLTDTIVQKDFITVFWSDNDIIQFPSLWDIGTYFPKIKSTLYSKILFHQFFDVYDALTVQMAGFDGTTTQFTANVHFMSGDNQYNIVAPVLDFSSAQVQQFDNPLRKFFEGLLIVIFGVWLVLRIFYIDLS